MSGPFLQVFPREIRDQIYTFILTTSDRTVGLLPWSHNVAKSLTIMRTCKQVHREVKDIIWLAHDLKVKDRTNIKRRFGDYATRVGPPLQHVHIDLEVMDRDEIEWIIQGLQAFTNPQIRRTLKSITLRTIWERPRDVKEYKDVLMLRKDGQRCDGRLIRENSSYGNLFVHTGWPRFSHWGKQKWLKEMLLDPTGELLREIHLLFGGDTFLDGMLIFSDKVQVEQYHFDPRNATVHIVPRNMPQNTREYWRNGQSLKGR